MLTDHATPRQVTAAISRFQTGIAAAGMPLFDSYDRAIFFLLVLRQVLGLRSGRPGRPISTHAIATSVDRPYSTVWRHVGTLVRDGFLLSERRSVTLADGVLDRTDVAAFLRATIGSFRDLTQALVSGNLLQLPDRTWADDRILAAAIDLLLCTVESACKADWTDLLLIGYVENAPAFDDANGEPAAVAGVVSLRRMAREVALPYSTVHRRTQALVEDGMLQRHGRAVGIAEHWLSGQQGASRSAAAMMCARKVFGRLATGETT